MPDHAPPLPAEYGAIKPGAIADEGPIGERWAWGRRRVPRDPSTGPGGRRTRAVKEAPRVSDSTDEAVAVADVGEHRRGRHRERVTVVRGSRSRRIVRRLDTWTVFKVSLVFYLCVLVVIIIAGVLLWNIAAAFGFLNSIDKSVKTLFDYTKFTLHPRAVLEYTIAAGAGLAVVGTLVNVVAALLYNLIADVVGGVQVVVVSDDD